MEENASLLCRVNEYCMYYLPFTSQLTLIFMTGPYLSTSPFRSSSDVNLFKCPIHIVVVQTVRRKWHLFSKTSVIRPSEEVYICIVNLVKNVSVRLLSVLRGHAFFPSPPQRHILILQKEPVFPFWCWVPNKGTTGTIFITLWYDPVLGWGLNPRPPPLEANTLPLGYRGGINLV